jgi:hypothetical protein
MRRPWPALARSATREEKICILLIVIKIKIKIKIKLAMHGHMSVEQTLLLQSKRT